MILRYPNVRLAMFNRLAADGDCQSAFLGTARECGLSVGAKACEGKRRLIDGGGCPCLSSARWILQSCAPEDADHLFKELVEEVRKYDHRFEEHLPSKKKRHEKCDMMAPVMMDFLLQILERRIP